MTGKRGRKAAKVDHRAKLERSRQSARECRARKKLRYQYLEELVTSREKANAVLKEELQALKKQCKLMDEGIVPEEVKKMAAQQNGKEVEQEEMQTSDLATDGSQAGKVEYWDSASSCMSSDYQACSFSEANEYSDHFSQQADKYQDGGRY